MCSIKNGQKSIFELGKSLKLPKVQFYVIFKLNFLGATGDIAFMDKILEDFRSFCRNDHDRLREFWKNCWDAHNKSNGVEEAHDSILKAVDLAQLSDY